MPLLGQPEHLLAYPGKFLNLQTALYLEYKGVLCYLVLT